MSVELPSFVVETVRDLVPHEQADVPVVQSVGLGGVEERRLQNACWEVDVVHAGVVKRVDGRRRGEPFLAIHRLTDLCQLTARLKLGGPQIVSEGVAAHDLQLRIVAPVVGIPDLVRDHVQLFLGARLGGWRSSSPANRCRDPSRPRCRESSAALSPCWQPGIAARRRPCPALPTARPSVLRHAAFPARLQLRNAHQLPPAEIELLVIHRLRQNRSRQSSSPAATSDRS